MRQTTTGTVHPIELTPLLKARCRYPRLHGDKGTVLIIDVGYFIQRECIRGFIQNGWRVVLVPLNPPERFIESLLIAIVTRRPDILFTVNHLGFDQDGVLTRMLNEIEMPYVSWFVDSPAYILLDHLSNSSPMAITPVWERSNVDFLGRFGFEHVFHLPLAGDPTVFRSNNSIAQAVYDISFVGDSMTISSAKWRNRCKSLNGVNELLSRAANNLFANRQCSPLEHIRSVADSDGIEIPRLTLREELNLSSAVVLEATRIYRYKVAGILVGNRLNLFGDNGWNRVTGSDAIVHAPVDYYRDLPRVYRASSVNLNLTSFQMPMAVNQRVFDAPLAGGFLLTDYQDDLELLFNTEKETATFTNIEELPELSQYYLRNESLRRSISQRAAKRILAQHTYRDRVNQIIGYARKVFASGSRVISANQAV